ERKHRQVDVVLFEVEHARRIVHQHIGVEHKQLGSGRMAGLGGLAGREKMDWRWGGAELTFDHGPPGRESGESYLAAIRHPNRSKIQDIVPRGSRCDTVCGGNAKATGLESD